MNEEVDSEALSNPILKSLGLERGKPKSLLRHLGLRQLCVIDSDWRMLFCHDNRRDKASGAAVDLKGRGYLDLLPAGLAGEVRQCLQRNRRGEVADCECRVGLGGAATWMEIRCSPVMEGDTYAGSLIAVREAVESSVPEGSFVEGGEAQDLPVASGGLGRKGARKAAEPERADGEPVRSRQLYKSILKNMLDVIVTFDTEGLITYVSPNLERYGYSSEEVIGRHVLEFVDPQDRGKVAEDLEKTLTTGEEFPTEFRMLANDGSRIFMEERGRVIREGGRMVGIASVLRDITERGSSPKK
jgi:PAS domain S-box-containing protein